MIVVAIIAILTAAFTLYVRGITNQNNATAMEATANKLRNAIFTEGLKPEKEDIRELFNSISLKMGV